MIKEFALGLGKRHYFQDAKETPTWQKFDVFRQFSIIYK